MLKERLYKAFNEKNAIQRQISRRLFEVFEVFGFYLVSDHFYEIIPNTNLIRSTYKDSPRDILGVDLNFESSERYICQLISKYASELSSEIMEKYGFSYNNYYFSGLDPLALYLVIRDRKPKRIVEVGQGMSTRIILAALEMNFKENGVLTQFTSIDPYSRIDNLKVNEKAVDFKIEKEAIQETGLKHVMELKADDFLFVDSSQVYKFGSDVEYEFEVLYPSLSPGVIIHIHDIFSPYDYPYRWMIDRKQFWNEQYHIENFLRFNESFKVLLPMNYLVRNSENTRNRINDIKKYKFDFKSTSSFYMERV